MKNLKKSLIFNVLAVTGLLTCGSISYATTASPAWDIATHFQASDFLKDETHGDISDYTHDGLQTNPVPVWLVNYSRTILIPEFANYPIIQPVCATFYNMFINISSVPNWQSMSIKNSQDLTIATKLAAQQVQESAGILSNPNYHSQTFSGRYNIYYGFYNKTSLYVTPHLYNKATWIQITFPNSDGTCDQLVHRD